MKNLFIHVILVSFLSILFGCSSESNAIDNKDVSIDWLLGDWQRINEVDGKRTYEFWKKSGKDYEGIGYTLRDIDTVFMETMKIHLVNEVWNLEISGPNENPTIFVFRELSENKFIADCPSNDFPKTISYSTMDDNLHAVISDSAMSITFDFGPMTDL